MTIGIYYYLELMELSYLLVEGGRKRKDPEKDFLKQDELDEIIFRLGMRKKEDQGLIALNTVADNAKCYGLGFLPQCVSALCCFNLHHTSLK